MLLIVVIVLGGAILAAIAYYITRYMRGSIKLSLPLTVFDPGATITGSFDLETKKDIKGNKLIVSLIAIEKIRTHDSDGDTRTRSKEVYRDEVLIEEAKDYIAGFTAKYDFRISTPGNQTPDPETPGIISPQVVQGLATAFKLLSNRSATIKWKVEARLDAKGVDLVATKSISINTKQFM